MKRIDIIIIVIVALAAVAVAYFLAQEQKKKDTQRALDDAALFKATEERGIIEGEILIAKQKRISELLLQIPSTCAGNAKSTSTRPGSNQCAPYQSLILELQQLRGY